MSDVVEGRSDERTSPSKTFSSSRVRMNILGAHSTYPNYNLAELVRATKLNNGLLHEN